MNILEMLEQQHRETEQAFAANDHEKVKQLLEVHDAIEMEVLYPAMRNMDAELTSHGEEEHAEIRELIAGLPETMAELEESVNHHVQEEENEMWPVIRENCTETQLEEMGLQAEQVQEHHEA